jgi:hypothetical protein
VTLAFPLVKSAAALLTEVAEGEDPGPSLPGDFAPGIALIADAEDSTGAGWPGSA